MNDEEKRQALFISPRFYVPNKPGIGSGSDAVSAHDSQSVIAPMQEIEEAEDVDAVASQTELGAVRKKKQNRLSRSISKDGLKAPK